jgi:hypothetical protein
MTWTMAEIEALARRRGLTLLTPEHLAQWLAAANAQPDTTALRDAVARKEDEPAYGPEAFANPDTEI